VSGLITDNKINLLKKRGDLMFPEKLEFLKQFDIFYKVMVNSIKEEKINESDFYALIRAKCKNMERLRREEIIIKVELVE